MDKNRMKLLIELTAAAKVYIAAGQEGKSDGETRLRMQSAYLNLVKIVGRAENSFITQFNQDLQKKFKKTLESMTKQNEVKVKKAMEDAE